MFFLGFRVWGLGYGTVFRGSQNCTSFERVRRSSSSLGSKVAVLVEEFLGLSRASCRLTTCLEVWRFREA